MLARRRPVSELDALARSAREAPVVGWAEVGRGEAGAVGRPENGAVTGPA